MTPDAIRSELRRLSGRRRRREDQDTRDIERIVELVRQGKGHIRMEDMAADTGYSREHLYWLLRR